ncbi:hypothetical protein C4546_02470 [Candidatus Parcubacteria bacterium]|jgi:hypothetical protein|nr:MAG: hypothetical protein C4546_02470 [Candidatus Parcubacteria bacterium]
MKKTSLSVNKLGFLHSVGVVIYILIVAWILSNAETWFGRADNLLGPLAFLLLFTLSAAIVGLLVFGRPVYLFLNGKKKEAVSLTFTTLGFLFVEALIFFLTLATWH